MNKNPNVQRKNTILAMSMALMAMLGMTRLASAQFPAQGSDGHAHDANTRVGSGGQNSGRGNVYGASSNDIINRNVTGLGAFHGPINERDARAFSGPLPGQGVDSFIRQSAGSPTGYGVQAPLIGEAQTYYGEARFTAPPIGAIPLGFTGGYIGTIPQTPASLANGFNTAQYLDGLQSRTTDSQTLLLRTMLDNGLPVSQELFNQTGTLNYIPPYGMRTINSSDNFLTPGFDRFGVEPQSIDQMRQELQQPAKPNQPSPNGTDESNPQANALNAPLNQPLGRAFDAASDAAVANRPVSVQPGTGPLSSTGINSATWIKPSLIPAEQQSPLLGTLQKRLEESSGIGKAIADTHIPRPQTPAAQNANRGNGANPATARSGPVKVSSLAEGIKAKGLHDLLAGGEDLIRQGKYDQAIGLYNQAQRVAPNNSLTVLGRAQAELAGGYYARAETDLRSAYRFSPSLQLMQFDLAALLPRGRLDFLRKDLQELAQKDPTLARPWLLLGYLDFNTGDVSSAEKDLIEASKRSTDDSTIQHLRQFWTTSSKTSAPTPAVPELNK